MSKKDAKNPNYRPRDAKGHYVKSGNKDCGTKDKPSSKPRKTKAECGKTARKPKPSKADAEATVIGILSGMFVPGTCYVEMVETETEAAHSEIPHDIAPDTSTARESRLDSLIRDNESLRTNLGELTTKLLDEKSRNLSLSQRIKTAERRAEDLEDRASTHRIALIASSAISFIAGCLTAASIACR